MFAVDWKALDTPLGLPGQQQAICTRTFFVPLSKDLAPKDPEIHYYATSLASHQADAAKLAGLIRGHWGIENRLHHVKDRTFLEDRHWVKNPATAYVLTFLRSLAVGLLHTLKIPGRSGRAYCPEKIEYIQCEPGRALRMVCGEK